MQHDAEEDNAWREADRVGGWKENGDPKGRQTKGYNKEIVGEN